MANIRFVKPPNDNRIRPLSNFKDNVTNKTSALHDVSNKPGPITTDTLPITTSKNNVKNKPPCDLFITSKTDDSSRSSLTESTAINSRDKRQTAASCEATTKHSVKNADTQNQGCKERTKISSKLSPTESTQNLSVPLKGERIDNKLKRGKPDENVPGNITMQGKITAEPTKGRTVSEHSAQRKPAEKNRTKNPLDIFYSSDDDVSDIELGNVWKKDVKCPTEIPETGCAVTHFREQGEKLDEKHSFLRHLNKDAKAGDNIHDRALKSKSTESRESAYSSSKNSSLYTRNTNDDPLNESFNTTKKRPSISYVDTDEHDNGLSTRFDAYLSQREITNKSLLPTKKSKANHQTDVTYTHKEIKSDTDDHVSEERVTRSTSHTSRSDRRIVPDHLPDEYQKERDQTSISSRSSNEVSDVNGADRERKPTNSDSAKEISDTSKSQMKCHTTKHPGTNNEVSSVNQIAKDQKELPVNKSLKLSFSSTGQADKYGNKTAHSKSFNSSNETCDTNKVEKDQNKLVYKNPNSSNETCNTNKVDKDQNKLVSYKNPNSSNETCDTNKVEKNQNKLVSYKNPNSSNEIPSTNRVEKDQNIPASSKRPSFPNEASNANRLEKEQNKFASSKRPSSPNEVFSTHQLEKCISKPSRTKSFSSPKEVSNTNRVEKGQNTPYSFKHPSSPTKVSSTDREEKDQNKHANSEDVNSRNQASRTSRIDKRPSSPNEVYSMDGVEKKQNKLARSKHSSSPNELSTTNRLEKDQNKLTDSKHFNSRNEVSSTTRAEKDENKFTSFKRPSSPKEAFNTNKLEKNYNKLSSKCSNSPDQFSSTNQIGKDLNKLARTESFTSPKAVSITNPTEKNQSKFTSLKRPSSPNEASNTNQEEKDLDKRARTKSFASSKEVSTSNRLEKVLNKYDGSKSSKKACNINTIESNQNKLSSTKSPNLVNEVCDIDQVRNDQKKFHNTKLSCSTNENSGLHQEEKNQFNKTLSLSNRAMTNNQLPKVHLKDSSTEFCELDNEVFDYENKNQINCPIAKPYCSSNETAGVSHSKKGSPACSVDKIRLAHEVSVKKLEEKDQNRFASSKPTSSDSRLDNTKSFSSTNKTTYANLARGDESRRSVTELNDSDNEISNNNHSVKDTAKDPKQFASFKGVPSENRREMKEPNCSANKFSRSAMELSGTKQEENVRTKYSTKISSSTNDISGPDQKRRDQNKFPYQTEDDLNKFSRPGNEVSASSQIPTQYNSKKHCSSKDNSGVNQTDRDKAQCSVNKGGSSAYDVTGRDRTEKDQMKCSAVQYSQVRNVPDADLSDISDEDLSVLPEISKSENVHTSAHHGFQNVREKQQEATEEKVLPPSVHPQHQQKQVQSEAHGTLHRRSQGSIKSICRSISDVALADEAEPSFFKSINDAKYYGVDKDEPLDTDERLMKAEENDKLSELNGYCKRRRSTKTAWDAGTRKSVPSCGSEKDLGRKEDRKSISSMNSPLMSEQEDSQILISRSTKRDSVSSESISFDRLKMRRCALADPEKMIMSQEDRERIEKEMERKKASMVRKVSQFLNVQLGLNKEEELI